MNLIPFNPVLLPVRCRIMPEPPHPEGNRAQQDDDQHGRRRNHRRPDQHPFPFCPVGHPEPDQLPLAVKVTGFPGQGVRAQLRQEIIAGGDKVRVDIPVVFGKLRVDQHAQAALQLFRRHPAGPKGIFQLFRPFLRVGEAHERSSLPL